MPYKSAPYFLIFFIGLSAYSQDFKGLWKATKVQIGDQEMTPVAKWFNFQPDFSYTSGNGGINNSKGTWHYNEEKGELLPIEKDGIKDEAGPFKIQIDQDTMTWRRTEGGQQLMVTLLRINEKPLAIWDKLYGAWKLVSIDQTSVIPENRSALLMRWDREFRQKNSEGTIWGGYWHINSHNPEPTLIPFGSDLPVERWMVSIEEDELRFTGVSDSNQGKTKNFKRTDIFFD